MRKRLFASVISISAISLLFSCTINPDVTFDKKKQMKLTVDENGIITSATLQCPNEGDDCAIICKTNGTIQQRAMLDSFYAAYNRNDLGNFFNNYNWTSIFPGLNVNTGIKYNIEHGIYKIRVVDDGDIIVTTTTDSKYTEDEVLLAYKVIPCE